MVAPSTDYGLPPGQVIPTDVLNALFPYFSLQGNTALQLALAQYGNQNAGAQLQAGLAGDAMKANAATAAAGIGAGASAYGAQVGALAQLAAVNAQAANQVLIASGGDQNAANRLAAELMMNAGLANQSTDLQAQLANQQMGWNLAKAAGSGDLRENFARMLYLGGGGPQPGLTSALNGLPSPWVTAQQVTAPGVNFTPYGEAAQASMNLPAYQGGNIPTFSAPNIQMPNTDLGALYSSLYGTLGGLAGGGFGAPLPGSTGGTVPGGGSQYSIVGGDYMPTPIADPANDAAAAAKKAAYLASHSMAGGGIVRLARGDTVQVGEGLNQEGVRMGTSELIKPIADGFKVMPQVRPGVEEYRDPNSGRVTDYTSRPLGMATGGSISGAIPGFHWYNPEDAIAPGVTLPSPQISNLGGLPGPALPTGAPGGNISSLWSKFLPPQFQNQPGFTYYKQPMVTMAPNPAPEAPVYDAGLSGVIPEIPAGGSPDVRPGGTTDTVPTGPTVLQPGQLTPGGPTVSQLPFFQALMSGNISPSAWGSIPRPTAPELGITGGIPLPWERASTFRRSDPIQQQAMSQLWSYLGVPIQMQQYWINQATPGFRFSPTQGLGF